MHRAAHKLARTNLRMYATRSTTFLGTNSQSNVVLAFNKENQDLLCLETTYLHTVSLPQKSVIFPEKQYGYN